MSLYDYQESKLIVRGESAGEPSFYALVMAAMIRADTVNAAKLREVFPETWAELDARYHAPGGLLPGERLGADVDEDEGARYEGRPPLRR